MTSKRRIIYSVTIIIRSLLNILEDLNNYNDTTLNKFEILLDEIYNKL